MNVVCAVLQTAFCACRKKHLEQADIYFKYKGKKPLTESEQILLTAAKDYLMSDRRYETLSNQYEKEQEQLTQEVMGYKTMQEEYEKDRISPYLRLVHTP